MVAFSTDMIAEFTRRALESIRPTGFVGEILATAAGFLALYEIFKYTHRPLKRWYILRIQRPWSDAKLDDVARQLVQSERKYLATVINTIPNRKWNPQRYVKRRVEVKEKLPAPMDPVLVLLGAITARDISKDMTLQERREQFRKERIDDLSAAVRRLRNLVILGEPGSGKTTCLIHLCLEVASASLLSATQRPTIPIFLPLNEFTQPLSPTAVFEFIQEQLKHQADASSADITRRIRSLLRDGRILFLFDAIDEMPRDAYYERFAALSSFMRSHKNNSFVFSCRLNDYIDDPHFPHQAVLSPFSTKQIKTFFDRYLGSLGRSAFNQFISHDADLASQARTPFYLSLISACVEAGVQPGATWDVLLKNYVEVILEQERDIRGCNRREWEPILKSATDWLAVFAFELTRTRATGTKADPELVRETLEEVGAETSTIEVLRAAGIVRRLADGSVRFEHHRLQEYFAARHLVHLFETDEVDIYDYLDDIWWREVLIMAAGMMSAPEVLIDEILEAADESLLGRYSDISYNFGHVMLAIACYRPAKRSLPLHTRSRLAELLVFFMRDGNILQQVRALRVAPQFDDHSVASETKLLLRDPSRWVRETALAAVVEAKSSASEFSRIIADQVLTVFGGEESLVQGLQDFPLLLRHRKTRWFIPLHAISMLAALLKSASGWLIFAAIVYYHFRTGALGRSAAGWWVGIPMVSYLFVKMLMRRDYIRGTFFRWGLADSLNKWVLWFMAMFTVNRLSATVEDASARIGTTGNVIVTVLMLPLYYWGIRNIGSAVEVWGGVYLKWKQRTSFDISRLVPEKTIEARGQQARGLLERAKEEQSPLLRERLIDALRVLLPLDREILTELEEMGEFELDVDVRTGIWRVYEQVELALQREGMTGDRDRLRPQS